MEQQEKTQSHHTYVITFLSLPLLFQQNGGSDIGPTVMELLIIILPPGKRSLFRRFLAAKPRLVCQGEVQHRLVQKLHILALVHIALYQIPIIILLALNYMLAISAPSYFGLSQILGPDSGFQKPLFCRTIVYCCVLATTCSDPTGL